jgi:hypothetical protein
MYAAPLALALEMLASVARFHESFVLARLAFPLSRRLDAVDVAYDGLNDFRQHIGVYDILA